MFLKELLYLHIFYNLVGVVCIPEIGLLEPKVEPGFAEGRNYYLTIKDSVPLIRAWPEISDYAELIII